MRVVDGIDRMVILQRGRGDIDREAILAALRSDLVVLIRGLTADEADQTIQRVVEKLGLREQLELQAGFAAFRGHRHNIGKYYMTVNRRGDYQFIPPHCEGTRFVDMQLASFYCYENSTDGGESILLNVNDADASWESLREKVCKARPGSRILNAKEIARARGLYHVDLPRDIVGPDDQILKEVETDVPGLGLVDVLAKPRKSYSRVLERELRALWDSVASIDFDCAKQYAAMLIELGLLKQPSGMTFEDLDNTAKRHIWRSGADYSTIFRCAIVHKLRPGDFLIQNNITWAHATNNWTPGSGVRNIAAAFA